MGAGGTSGGTERFLLGLAMFVVGGYLMLNAIHVNWYNSFYIGGMRMNTGFLMIPFIFGIGLTFFNYRNIWGWVLMFGSLGLLVVGVISSVNFSIRHMTSFELIGILVLLFGGLGLFLSSFRGS
ncbi:hypothetical protein [Eisenibacter elegans]|jgi:hypothetical protein|uniref:hypothetical protein n=1 Tax=Eisenibacter elegans TaxID=997 RepID=UPI0003F901EF|nr:hypothetical protein [Eisenibacter elegans]